MCLTPYEAASLGVAFCSVVIALLSMQSSSKATARSNRAAEKSAELAEKMTDIAEFEARISKIERDASAKAALSVSATTPDYINGTVRVENNGEQSIHNVFVVVAIADKDGNPLSNPIQSKPVRSMPAGGEALFPFRGNLKAASEVLCIIRWIDHYGEHRESIKKINPVRYAPND